MHTFRSAIEARDVDALLDQLSPGVVFRSPVVFREYAGREAVAPILRTVVQVVEEVVYTRELGGDGPGETQALVFSARVGGKDVEGCDFVTLGEDGLVEEVVVMVRPITAAIALAEAMNAAMSEVHPCP